MSGMAWPVKLVFRKSEGALHAEFDDGKSGMVSYKRLREQSPSAEVRGHGSGPPPPQAPVPDDISVLARRSGWPLRPAHHVLGRA